MLQKSMFSSCSHIICYFAELCHCINYLKYEESKVRKYGSLQHRLAFRGSFVPVSDTLSYIKKKDKDREVTRAEFGTLVTSKIKLWRSLQCICASLDSITISWSISHPICLSHTVSWSCINEWNITGGYSFIQVKTSRTTCCKLHTSNSITLKVFI